MNVTLRLVGKAACFLGAHAMSMAVSGLVTAVLDAARGLLGSTAWGPLVKISRTAVLSLLQQIENGQLTIIENGGTVTICGSLSTSSAHAPATTVQAKRDAFWLRLALFADMVSLRRRRQRRTVLSD